MMGNIEDDDDEDPPLGDSPGDTTLVGDSLPSSKLLAARAATAEAFSLSSGLILQTAWGSGTQLPRMELIWSSDTGDRGTSVVRTVLMLVWIGGRGLVKFSSSALTTSWGLVNTDCSCWGCCLVTMLLCCGGMMILWMGLAALYTTCCRTRGLVCTRDTGGAGGGGGVQGCVICWMMEAGLKEAAFGDLGEGEEGGVGVGAGAGSLVTSWGAQDTCNEGLSDGSGAGPAGAGCGWTIKCLAPALATSGDGTAAAGGAAR